MIEFDFLRATEMAALNSLQWLGKGDKIRADEAASDAIRGMFDIMDIRGEVVIGEGIKDEAPGLFKGERVGMWREGAPMFDVALDPIDGTTNLSKGLPNAISCIAAASRDDGEMNSLQDTPAFYMKKLAYPPAVRDQFIADPKLPIDVCRLKLSGRRPTARYKSGIEEYHQMSSQSHCIDSMPPLWPIPAFLPL